MKSKLGTLNLICCFFMTFGLLTLAEAQAFTKDDEVVLQNTYNGRNVRTHPIVHPDTLIGYIVDGTRGTFLQGPIKDDYLWYEVRWRIKDDQKWLIKANQRWRIEDGELKAWVALPIDECSYIGSVEEAERRDAITAALFKLPEATIDTTTFHDYNGYGCNTDWEIYDYKGHAGLDVQTQKRTKYEMFYSLTDGIVTIAGFSDKNGNREEDDDEKNTWKTIGIYDPDAMKTTFYLHASWVHPDIKKAFKNGTPVKHGDPLGTEGDSGSFGRIHVHLEVHKGESMSPVKGKTEGKTEDPIDYLYKWVLEGKIRELLEIIKNLQDKLGISGSPQATNSFPFGGTPEEDALHPNYPNPFNPETWIPYQLAEDSEVTITIYNANGTIIRKLSLGHQAAGVYQSKARAAYWDGRNELGEPVAGGVYFYTFTAGDFTATRKMLIRK